MPHCSLLVFASAISLNPIRRFVLNHLCPWIWFSHKRLIPPIGIYGTVLDMQEGRSMVSLTVYDGANGIGGNKTCLELHLTLSAISHSSPSSTPISIPGSILLTSSRRT